MTMQKPAFWPTFPIAIFDYDSTLSAVEGIDELAGIIESESSAYRESESGGMAVKVAALTKRAMEGDLPLEAGFCRRVIWEWRSPSGTI